MPLTLDTRCREIARQWWRTPLFSPSRAMWISVCLRLVWSTRPRSRRGFKVTEKPCIIKTRKKKKDVGKSSWRPTGRFLSAVSLTAWGCILQKLLFYWSSFPGLCPGPAPSALRTFWVVHSTCTPPPLPVDCFLPLSRWLTLEEQGLGLISAHTAIPYIEYVRPCLMTARSVHAWRNRRKDSFGERGEMLFRTQRFSQLWAQQM